MFKFKINLSFLKATRASEQGAALAELALAFPIALTIVLVTIHLSHVLRESNVVVEAARHGARSVSAASAMSPALPPNDYELQAWAQSASGPDVLNCDPVPPTVNDPVHIAALAACGYLSEYFDTRWPAERARWQVTASIFQRSIVEGPITSTFWFTSVEVAARDNRGPVEHLRAFFSLKPNMTATFPLMRVGE